jgi:acyl-CoA thioesterase-1
MAHLKPKSSNHVVIYMRNDILNSTILFILLSLLSIGCESAEDIVIATENEEMPSMNYLALGDSYTIGQGVPMSDRWPIQLSQQLVQNDFALEKVDFIAQTGWTTSNLLNAIENTNLDSTNYQLVSLLIGVNNQYQGKPFSLYEAEFDLLLKKAIEIAGEKEKVFAVSIPDYGVTPFRGNNSESIAREIDQYNAYAKQKCDEQNIPFIDITPISRQLGDSPGALAADNLHPSGSQYAQWVEEALPAVLEILNK